MRGVGGKKEKNNERGDKAERKRKKNMTEESRKRQ